MRTISNTVSVPSARRIMLILNPAAGRGQANRQLPEIINAFESSGHKVSVFTTTKKGDASQFVTQYGADFHIIVCVGGDGTFNEVVTGIALSGGSVPVGYIPAGSANDFARSHRLSPDVTLAVHKMLHASGRQIDIGKLNERYFCYVAAFGAFTSVSYSTSQPLKNAFGYAAYVLSGIRDLSRIKAEHVRVSADSGVYEGDYVFGAICNTLSMGGLMSLPADAVAMDDGIFEVLLIRTPETVLEWPSLLHALVNQNYSCKYIEFFHSGRLFIETNQPIEWTLDGEYACEGPVIQVDNMHRFLTLAADE